MNTDLERLLELVSLTRNEGLTNKEYDEMFELKSKLDEKLEKVCDFPLGIEQCAEHGKEIRDYKQQIKQLERDHKFCPSIKSALLEENKQLKEELDLERKKKGKYTRFGGGHRSNSCEFEVHGLRCEHGDCDCNCHEDERKQRDKIYDLESEIQSLKSQNEKLQKVVDVIKRRIKKIEDEYPYSNNCKPSDTNSDYILLKSILSEIEKE